MKEECFGIVPVMQEYVNSFLNEADRLDDFINTSIEYLKIKDNCNIYNLEQSYIKCLREMEKDLLKNLLNGLYGNLAIDYCMDIINIIDKINRYFRKWKQEAEKQEKISKKDFLDRIYTYILTVRNNLENIKSCLVNYVRMVDRFNHLNFSNDEYNFYEEF